MVIGLALAMFVALVGWGAGYFGVSPNGTVLAFPEADERRSIVQPTGETWDLPADIKGPIMRELQDKFEFLIDQLRAREADWLGEAAE